MKKKTNFNAEEPTFNLGVDTYRSGHANSTFCWIFFFFWVTNDRRPAEAANQNYSNRVRN